MTDLDDILNEDPLNLTREDIDSLVLHYRRQREGGPRPKKEMGVEKKIDLTEIGLKAPAAQAYVRRV